MLKTIYTRLKQGYRTNAYPVADVVMPAPYRGRPMIDQSCPPEVKKLCADSCPQQAIAADEGLLDLGRCVFCGMCQRAGDGKFIRFTNRFELAVADPAALMTDGNIPDLAAASRAEYRKLFGGSLQLRHVSAGGCNACEADVNVLNTPVFDLARFGIGFTASPRHADGILVSGPVPRNMQAALMATYEAIPAPKVVIAVGSCAISGGPFNGSGEVSKLSHHLPVDLFIPGCPPHPMTTLHALLAYFTGKIPPSGQ